MRNIKRILIISIIITLLSNYIVTLGNISNMVYAVTSENVVEGLYSLEVEADTSSKYKGMLYANLVLEEKQDISFSNNIKLNIHDFEKLETLEVSENNSIVRTEGVEIELANEIQYKTTSISAEEFKRVLGEDGYIEVYNQMNEKIGEIRPEEDAEVYTYTYPKLVHRVSFVLKGIKANGELNLKNQKVIVGEKGFTKEDILNLKSIKIKNESIAKMVETSEEVESNEIEEIIEEPVVENIIQEDEIIEEPIIEEPVNELENSTTDVIIEEGDKTVLNTEQVIEDTIIEEAVENDLLNKKSEVEIKLEDTETKIEMKMNNTSFSTTEETSVTFNISLKSNSEQYELFQNPSIELDFPYSMEDVKIESINLLYKNGLSLSDWNVSKNEQNENVLKINLEGTQSEYKPGTLIDGTMINIVAKVKLNELTTSDKGSIKLKYTNQIGTRTSYEVAGKDYEEYEVKFVSKNELLKLLTFEGFNDKNEIISNLNTSINIGKTEIASAEKNAKVTMKVVNNLREDIKNVVIVGKIPYIGNSDGNGNTLDTVIDTTMNGAVLTTGLSSKIYYSEKENTELDSDNWFENVEDYSKVKEFKIVLDNEIVHQGESVELSYGFNIPANLIYNQTAAGANIVYYQLNDENKIDNTVYGIETDKEDIKLENLDKIDTITKETEIVPQETITEEEVINPEQNIENSNESTIEEVLKIGTQVTKGGNVLNDGDEVEERQLLKYTTIIKNTSDKEIKDIVIKGNAHNTNMYYWNTFLMYSDSLYKEVTTGEWAEDTDGSHKYDEMTISTLLPGEEAKFEYQVLVRGLENLESQDKEVYGKISVKAEGIEEKEIETIRNTIKDSDVEVKLSRGDYYDLNYPEVYSGDQYYLKALVKNISNKTLKNVAVNFILPANLEYDTVTEFLNPDYNLKMEETSTGSIVTVTIPELKSGEEQDVRINTLVDELDVNLTETQATVKLNVLVDGKEYLANEHTQKISQTETKYDVQFYNDKAQNEPLQDGDSIKYTYVLKNIGQITTTESISADYSTGLILENAKIYREDGSVQDIEITESEEVEETSEDTEEIDEIMNEGVDGEIEGEAVEEGAEESDDLVEYSDKSLSYNFEIKPNETVKFEIETKVDLEQCLEDQTEIENSVGITSGSTATLQSELEIPENYYEEKFGPKEEVVEDIIDEEEIISDDELEISDETNEDGNLEGSLINDDIVSIDENEIEIMEPEEELIEDEVEEELVAEVYKDIVLDDESSVKDYTVKGSDYTNLPISVNNISQVDEDGNIANIEGIVWLDESADGMQDSFEKVQQNVEIILFDLNKNGIVQKTKTNNEGKYKFFNVDFGDYIVLFEYDNSKYNFTQYQTEDGNTYIVSDVISNRVIENKAYALTDKVSIEDSETVISLNMGLIPVQEFDLGVSSYISEVKVEQGEDEETFTFEEDQTSELILDSKYGEAELSAKLKIKVSNNGTVDGFVNQIKSVIPEGWEYDNELNQNWNIGENGNIYYTGFDNLIIQAGRSEELVLTIGKKIDRKSDNVIKTEATINNLSNDLQIDDKDSENNITTTEFSIKSEKDFKEYVILIVIVTILFAVILSLSNVYLLKKFDKRKVKLINRIVILIYVLVMFIALIGINKTEAVTVNGLKVGGKHILDSWAYGAAATGGNHGRLAHYNITDYMTNFYGVGTRQNLLDTNYEFSRSDQQIRTVGCLHGTSLSWSLKSAYNKYTYRIVSAIDLGYNDGRIKEFNRLYGTYNRKVFNSKGNLNVSEYVATSNQAQTMAYFAYVADSYVKKFDPYSDNQLIGKYLHVLPYMLKELSNASIKNLSYNDALSKVSGFAIKKSSLSWANQVITYGGKAYITDAQTSFENFYKNNVKNFKITKAANVSTKTIRVVNQKSETKLGVVKISGKNKYIGPFKVKMPLSSNKDGIVNNSSALYISLDKGKTWKKYTGYLYKYDSKNKKYKAYSLKKYRVNQFNNANTYLPYSAIKGASKTSNVRIRIKSAYYVYEGRMLYFFSGKQDQNKGVIRGRRYTTSSYVTFTIGTDLPGVKITKSIYSIDGSTSSKTYAEKGSTIVYNVKIECIGKGSISGVQFTDPISTNELTYASCVSATSGYTIAQNSSNKNLFVTTGEIDAGKSANFRLTYKVKSDNYANSKRKITNTATITKVKSGDGKSVLYDNGTKNSINSKSVYTSSVSCYMRMYSAKINTWVDAIITDRANDPTTKQDYSGRRYANDPDNDVVQELYDYDENGNEIVISADEAPAFVYAEPGDIVRIGIEVKNNGSAGSLSQYGNINDVAFTETYDANYFESLTTTPETVASNDYEAMDDSDFNFEIPEEEVAEEELEEDVETEDENTFEDVEESDEDTEDASDESEGLDNSEDEGAFDDFFETLPENTTNTTPDTNTSTGTNTSTNTSTGGEEAPPVEDEEAPPVEGISIDNLGENVGAINSYTMTGITLKPGESMIYYYTYLVKTKVATSAIEKSFVAQITKVKQKFGYEVYNGSTDLLSNLKHLNSSDNVKIRTYSISMSKELYKLGGTEITSDTVRPVYGETGDEVIFKLRVVNTGTNEDYGNIYKIYLEDTFNSSELEFVSFAAGGQTFTDGETSGNWSRNKRTDGSLSERMFIYNGKLERNSATAIYIKYKVKVFDNTNKQIINSVKLNNYINRNNTDITMSTPEDNDSFYLKKYAMQIKKYVTNLAGSSLGTTRSTNKNTTLYGETGDQIVFRIDVKNTGTANDIKFGDIHGIIIRDTYNSDQLTLLGMSTDGTNYTSELACGNWARRDNLLAYSQSIAPGNTATIYLKFEIKIMSKTTLDLNNTAEVIAIKNKNNISLKDAFSDLDDSDKVTLKIYSVILTKNIKSINGTAVTTQSNLTAEVGDTIIYTITIKNNGTSPTYGRIKSINLSEIFNSNQLVYTSDKTDYGNNWKRISGTNTFVNESGINVNSSSQFDLSMKVVYRNVVDNEEIINTAEIKDTDTVKNKNDINIRPVLNGTLKDSSELRYLTYHLDMRKYITNQILQSGSTVNYNTRIDKTNAEKYNSPVEVEKYDSIIYALRVENTGETTVNTINLYDELESGITFESGIIDAYVYANGISSSTNVKTKIQVKENTDAQKRNFVYAGALKPGETLIIRFKANIIKDNLYLWNLNNTATIVSTLNKHDIELIDPNSNILVLDRNDNQDWVRLKDVVVSGQVWIDTDKDGIMDSQETKAKDIVVNLVDVTNGKKTSVKTDANGYYKFNETSGMVSSDGRVVKATYKDSKTGNYTKGKSQYIQYYVEFEYNGARYKATSNYANAKNINSDYSYKDAYLTDSNATEYNDVRETFEDKLETISYNAATSTSGSTEPLTYTKDGHTSTIVNDVSVNSIITMKAQSFINPDAIGSDGIQSGDISYLWLNSQNGDTKTGETEYLKYINLGLKVQEFDLGLEKDVYQIRTTINGEEVIYNYNQGDVSGSGYGGEYVTGGINSPKNYEFLVYDSDYYYKRTQYSSEAVKEYKKNTELNIDVIYKITLKNNKEGITDDRENLYAVVNEITDFYTTNFKKYSPSANIKTVKLDKKAEGDRYVTDGILEDVNETITEAWYYEGSTKKALTIKNTTNHQVTNKDKTLAGYNKLYITGLDNIVLDRGEEIDLYIKYTVDKDSSGNLKIGAENTISEINSYSTYEDLGKSDPAGYIDIDSNPGNLGYNPTTKKFDSPEDYRLYEDDSYKTGIDLKLSTTKTGGSDKLERTLEGFVWDDARSEEVDKQYVGDGIFDTSKSKNSNAKSNTKISEEKDIPVQGVKAKLVELIDIPVVQNGVTTIRTYEETINPGSIAKVEVKTGSDGKYKISSFIPGKYVVRFEYGYYEDGLNASELQNVRLFNGQDYKSTAYNPELDANEMTSINVNSKAGDDVLKLLTSAGKIVSDARDDEIKRLETIRYSENMNNQKSEILQGITTNDALRDDLLKQANMYAETVAFPVRIEQGDYQYTIVSYTFDKYNQLIQNSRYSLNNIDFGIEYRPEVELELDKYVYNIKVKLSSGDELFNIVYDKVYEDDNPNKKVIGTKINTDKSIGVDNLQYLAKNEAANIKGFGYLNVDADVLQGTTIEIEYLFVTSNTSEIDRISQNLNAIRYKENAKTKELINSDVPQDKTYTASGMARNDLYKEFYKTDAEGKEYRAAMKLSEEYYGKYLGAIYYTGELNNPNYTSTNDVIAETKISGILDYVDNDLTFESSKNMDEDGFWKAVTSKDLKDGGFVSESVFEDGYLIDSDNRAFDTENRSNLAVSVDDARSDGDATNKNKDLSKFLLPVVENEEKAFGTISLLTNKTVATESDTDNMSYANTAEIISYVTLTGRVTRMGATIGSIDISQIDEDDPSLPPTPTPGDPDDPDTDTTETISLAPPTGRYRLRYFIKLHKQPITIATSIIIAIVIVSSSFIFIKNKKKLKKFYR